MQHEVRTDQIEAESRTDEHSSKSLPTAGFVCFLGKQSIESRDALRGQAEASVEDVSFGWIPVGFLGLWIGDEVAAQRTTDSRIDRRRIS